MLQNSAYGTPMLDGKPVPPEIYSPKEKEVTMKIDVPPQLINENDKILDFDYCGIVQQRYSVHRYIPEHDGRWYGQFDTNSTKHTPEQVQFAQATPKIHYEALKAYNVQPCKTDDIDTSQLKDDFNTKTATKQEVPFNTWKPSQLSPTEQTSAVDAVEVLAPNKMVAAAKKSADRRPMNAFLLFCKIHRPVIQAHFREENRAITKKLGKWWGRLSAKQKEPYQSLSKKYKSKYLAIYPGFCWCKSATTASSPSDANVGAEQSLSERMAIPMATEPEQTILDDRMIAAHALLMLRGIDYNPSMESMFNQGSSSAAHSSGIDKLQDQDVHNGVENTARASRSCKGKRYTAFKSQILPRAQCKQPTISKKKQKAYRDRANTVSVHQAKPTNFEELIEKLDAQRDEELSKIPALSIDDFLSMQLREKRHKKYRSSARKARTAVVDLRISPDEADIQRPLSAPLGINDHAESAPASSVSGVVSMAQPARPSGSRKRKQPRECITRYVLPKTDQE